MSCSPHDFFYQTRLKPQHLTNFKKTHFDWLENSFFVKTLSKLYIDVVLNKFTNFRIRMPSFLLVVYWNILELLWNNVHNLLFNPSSRFFLLFLQSKYKMALCSTTICIQKKNIFEKDTFETLNLFFYQNETILKNIRFFITFNVEF